jgi:HEAT repeat protein
MQCREAGTLNIRKDKNETVRGVAASAIGAFDHPDARVALEQAAKSESSSGARESIQKALKGEFRRKNR